MHMRHDGATTVLALLALWISGPAWASSDKVPVTLRWTAPGDDGKVGRARAYLLRYSTTPITEVSFKDAIPLHLMRRPRHAGSPESFRVAGLSPDTIYYFALKSIDDAGNQSPLSNVAVYPVFLTGVDGDPATLAFSAPWPNPAHVSLRCAFALPQPALLQVDAFSVDGRHVRRLAAEWRPAGRGEVVWDLRDDVGDRVPAGVYLVRAHLGASIYTRRVAVVP